MFKIDTSLAYLSLREVCPVWQRDCRREAQAKSRRGQNPELHPEAITSNRARSPCDSKRGGRAFHHAARVDKIPDPFAPLCRRPISPFAGSNFWRSEKCGRDPRRVRSLPRKRNSTARVSTRCSRSVEILSRSASMRYCMCWRFASPSQ